MLFVIIVIVYNYILKKKKKKIGRTKFICSLTGISSSYFSAIEELLKWKGSQEQRAGLPCILFGNLSLIVIEDGHDILANLFVRDSLHHSLLFPETTITLKQNQSILLKFRFFSFFLSFFFFFFFSFYLF